MTIAETIPTQDTKTEEERLEEQDSPHLELTTKVQLDDTNPEHCVGIGAELKVSLSRRIISFLKRNKKTFAWTTEDMPGISIEVASHQLNVDPSFKPVK